MPVMQFFLHAVLVKEYGELSGRRAGRRGKGEKKQRESVGRGTETVEDEKGEEEDVRKRRK